MSISGRARVFLLFSLAARRVSRYDVAAMRQKSKASSRLKGLATSLIFFTISLLSRWGRIVHQDSRQEVILAILTLLVSSVLFGWAFEATFRWAFRLGVSSSSEPESK
jgi:hypothetical protein